MTEAMSDRPQPPGPKTLFLQAVEQYNEEVVRPAAGKDRELWTHATLEDAIEEIQKAQQRSATSRGGTRKVLAKLQPALTLLNHYAPVLDTLVQAYPMPSALIWGGIRLLLQVASTCNSRFADFVQMLEDISDSFPRFQDYEKLFSSERLNAAILSAYQHVLEFLLLASRTFSTRGYKKLVKSMWQPLDDEFKRIVASLKRQTELADIEFGVLAVKKAEEERIAQQRERVKQEQERELLANERRLQEQERIEQEAERMRAEAARDLNAERVAREKIEREEKQRAEVMKWLSRLDTESAYSAARSRHAENPTSCAWVFETSEYKAWQSVTDPSHSLWINSGPGTGKTILAGHIVHTIKQQCTQDDSGFAYFFCSSRDGTKNDPLGPLRSILCQLLDSLAIIPDLLLREFEDQRRRGIELPYVLRPEMLQKLLLSTLGRFKSAYIVVDGIDECDDREFLLSCVSSLGIHSGERNTHVLVTSRAEPDIRRSLEPFTSIKIHPSDTKTDIRGYIGRCIKTITGIDEEERFAVKELSKKASGMFIWVRLVIDMLRDSASPQEFHEALVTIPRGLHQIYCLVIERIDKKISDSPKSRHDLARAVLRWLTLAVRPIRLSELCECLGAEMAQSLQPSSKKGWEHDLKYFTPSTFAVLDICATLVDRVDDTIKLLHHTAKDFLLGLPDHLPRSEVVKQYTIESDSGNMKIAETCLLYMAHLESVHEDICGTKESSGLPLSVIELEEQRNRLKVDIRTRIPFYEYACRHWSVHFARCSTDRGPWVAFLKFKNSMASFLWFQGWTLFHPHGRVPHSRQFRRLKQHNMNNWLEYMDNTFRSIGKKEQVDLRVVSQSWKRAFWRILAKGVENISNREDLQKSLRRACECEKNVIIEMLLERSGHIPADDDCVRESLSWAARYNHHGVLHAVFDVAADQQIYSYPDNETTVLVNAVVNEEVSLVKFLLGDRAYHPRRNSLGFVALSLALRYLYENPNIVFTRYEQWQAKLIRHVVFVVPRMKPMTEDFEWSILLLIAASRLNRELVALLSVKVLEPIDTQDLRPSTENYLPPNHISISMDAIYLSLLSQALEGNDTSSIQELLDIWPFQGEFAGFDAENLLSQTKIDGIRMHWKDFLLQTMYRLSGAAATSSLADAIQQLIVDAHKKKKLAATVLAWSRLDDPDAGTSLLMNIWARSRICPLGFSYERVEGGWKCEGGSHFQSDIGLLVHDAT